MRRNAVYLSHAAVVLFLVVMAMAREAQGLSTAEDLLNQKIEELNRFVGVVESNSRKCDVMDGCSYTCTRPSCTEYGTRGDKSYKCLGVQNNTFCDSCTDRNFDLTRSFLRRTDLNDENIVRTVCTHRNLDDSFLASSLRDPDHFFRVFFGAADGTFRIYPGADELCTPNGLLPTPYDPRNRPWYIESTYVPKIVTILIDTGFNMRTLYNGATDKETCGSKAINTALKFLPTLRRDQDYITIVAFDASGSKPLNETMIYSSDTLSAYTASLNLNIFQTKSVTNATATSNAINTAISDLTSSSSPAPPHYIKVVIVLTTGEQITNLSGISVTPNSGVNLFVYNFFPSARTDQCDPFNRASVEYIKVQRIDNPLYALQSYFTFMATVHKSFMRDTVDYGQRYQDFSGVDNSTLTLSKAAFGPSGELLGVVGIDFFEMKMKQQYPSNIQFQSIVTASRQHQISYATGTTNASISVCFNITDPCPNLASTSVPGFLCKKSTGDSKIGCCGSCLPGSGFNWKKWAPLIAVGAALLAIIIGLTIFYCKRKKRQARMLRENHVQVGDVTRDSSHAAGAGAGAGVGAGYKTPGGRKDSCW